MYTDVYTTDERIGEGTRQGGKLHAGTKKTTRGCWDCQEVSINCLSLSLSLLSELVWKLKSPPELEEIEEEIIAFSPQSPPIPEGI